MKKEIRLPYFISVCEKCGEINAFPKSNEVPAYCPICGQAIKYGSGYITYQVGEEGKKEEKVNSVADIEKVLYKQVELLAENSKECEPSELVKMTNCIANIYTTLVTYQDLKHNIPSAEEVFLQATNRIKESLK